MLKLAKAIAIWAAVAPLVAADAKLSRQELSGDSIESEAPTSPSSFPQEQRVAELIEELGQSRYVARRQAEQQLLEIGLKAFDQIDAATSNPDPEIAASCRYLLSELTVDWTRRDDPPQVKSLLAGYANFADERRLLVVQELSRLPDTLGLSPLCRICRYDASPTVARQAAVALLRVSQYDLPLSADVAPRLRQAVGTSVRPAAHWIRLLALQLESPAAAIPEWKQAIDRELATSNGGDDQQLRLGQGSALLLNLARLELQLGDRDGFLTTVDRLCKRTRSGAVPVLERMVEWTLAAESPALVDDLLHQHLDELRSTREGLYLMAAARADQGQQQLADQLAEEAFEFNSDDPSVNLVEARLQIGKALLETRHAEWGWRELREVIKQASVASEPHAEACSRLSDSLHDWQRNKEAAEVLAELNDALKSNAAARDTYSNRSRRSTMRLADYNQLLSYEHYFRACYQQTAGEHEEAWQSLEQAIKYDANNADIIIAMYHASHDDPARRKQVVERIKKRCFELEQEIDDNPRDARAYNEWAWLVSNTEGDFDKAVRYSHESLELIPHTPGFLDTLGRCYYAAGDYDSAIKYQSEAVHGAPHLQVLKRQLELFLQAREDQSSNES